MASRGTQACTYGCATAPESPSGSQVAAALVCMCTLRLPRLPTQVRLSVMTIRGIRCGSSQPIACADGCLLLQAGKQLEWLTGGHVQAGMHEVTLSGDRCAENLLHSSSSCTSTVRNPACRLCALTLHLQQWWQHGKQAAHYGGCHQLCSATLPRIRCVCILLR